MMVTANPKAAKSASVSRETALVEVPLDKLDPAPFNARADAAAGVDELVPSVRELGLLQPMLCRPKPGGRYELVAGERRYCAAKAAGLSAAPAVVRELSDAEALIAGLAENLARRNLNPIERARGLDRLVAPIDAGGAGLTTKAAGKLFGRSQEWCSNHTRLLRLPEIWQQRLAAGEVTERMARSLVPFVDMPDVLAAIERDREQNPWAWRTSTDFERSAKRIAVGEIRPPQSSTPDPRPLTPAVKPPRAAPSTFARATPAPSPQSPAPAARDYRLTADQAAERDSDEAFVPIRSGSTLEADAESDHDLDTILWLVPRLREAWQLDEVAQAIAKHRAKLAAAK
ncbi:MAG: hypothetical protein DCC68_11480 [Planctomycetota bacterium]|nr:MAG: hypothetical protein DCC68_11480 [Planctomycetota bacterium]